MKELFVKESRSHCTRRGFLFRAAASSFILSERFSFLERNEGRKPNVVYIFADNLGYGELGCYGNQVIKTPNIDKIAAEGVRFTDFYVTCPACTPSRSGLITGRYPQRNGLYEMIRNNEVNFGYKFDEEMYSISPEMTLGLDLRETTFGQAMKNVGYSTGVVGKWDSGRARRFLPLQRGFDFFYGFANTGIDYYTHERYGIPSMFRGNERIKEEGYATDLFGREAVRFIRENKDKPFFLYVPFNAPHGDSNLERTGHQAPEKYIRIYGEPPGSDDMRHKAKITCMDANIGKILSVLKELGLDENTLLIFNSDGGGVTNTPLRGGRSRMWEGGLRVPFIAKWPNHIPQGTISKEFCSTLDMFPTFLAAAGTKPPKGLILDGFNILPVMMGLEKSPRKEMFWEWRYQKAARMGKWKWTKSIDEGGLFDLSNDIREQNDLSKEKPEMLSKVKEKWAAWRKEMDESEPRGPFRNY